MVVVVGAHVNCQITHCYWLSRNLTCCYNRWTLVHAPPSTQTHRELHRHQPASASSTLHMVALFNSFLRVHELSSPATHCLAALIEPLHTGTRRVWLVHPTHSNRTVRTNVRVLQLARTRPNQFEQKTTNECCVLWSRRRYCYTQTHLVVK